MQPCPAQLLTSGHEHLIIVSNLLHLAIRVLDHDRQPAIWLLLHLHRHALGVQPEACLGVLLAQELAALQVAGAGRNGKGQTEGKVRGGVV